MGLLIFFFQAEDGIRDADVTGVQTCALPISAKGVTGDFVACRRCTLISIHAPAKGATRCRASAAASVRFQSTLPRRERPVQ